MTTHGGGHGRGRAGSRWFRAATAAVMLVTLAGCGNGDGDVEGSSDRVQVDLLSTVDTLVGHRWPTDGEGELSEVTAIERPTTVEVRLGEERSFEATSQLTFLDQIDDEIVRVALQPPAELGELAEVLDDVEALLERNGALTSELSATLEEWRAHEESVPEWPVTGDRLGRRVELEPGVELAVRLRQRGDEGWFYTVSLFRPVETWPTPR